MLFLKMYEKMMKRGVNLEDLMKTQKSPEMTILRIFSHLKTKTRNKSKSCFYVADG